MTFLNKTVDILKETLAPVLDPIPESNRTVLDEFGNFRGDHDLNPASFPQHNIVYKPAAVLVPIVHRQSKPHVILTRRAGHLNKHAGQISFPGGRAEETDQSVVDTALRESHEEIGLVPSRVDVLGTLNTYLTVTHYSVTPVVGLVEPEGDFVAEVNEVSEIFEVPLDFLIDAENHQKHSGFHNGIERFWYAMPYNDYYIWGATAGMIKDLSDRISD
ncbi:CoA pyrophosphatase [Sneathiella aquimaris]|uniref:CoA pyrophosphatase n=1 Tax=Sneathiella aquimaris TaxID=2599305 RepID=UPI00146A0D1D|nr:CoA pyrophosphatase [Sneathiella aquimaris]